MDTDEDITFTQSTLPPKNRSSKGVEKGKESIIWNVWEESVLRKNWKDGENYKRTRKIVPQRKNKLFDSFDEFKTILLILCDDDNVREKEENQRERQ